ncbi:MAG: hypothetical protein ACLPID_00200 [Beijerinckiaceae bacterium]
MPLSSVPLVPLRQGPPDETPVRPAPRAKLERLRLQLACQRTRAFFATKNPFDWPSRIFVVGSIVASLASRVGIIAPSLVFSAAGIYLAALCSAYLLVLVGKKLGLIDPAFAKDKADNAAGDFVYSHQKPETSIEDFVTPTQAPAKSHEPPVHAAFDGQAKTSEWQVVEIKNLGKIRYHFSDSDGPKNVGPMR